MKIKDIIQTILIKTTGYYLQKYEYPVSHVDCVQTIKSLLKYHQPKRLYDIGANSGHWSSILKNYNPNIELVVLFEPQKKHQEELIKLDLGDTRKIIYPLGLGSNSKEELLIGGTPAASILKIDQEKEDKFSGIFKNESEAISIEILDELIIRDNLPWADTIKIDVQGYELEVLIGSVNALRHAQYLVLELSFDEFYIEQPKNWEILRFVEETGYKLIDHGFEWREDYNPNKPLIQIDAIFRNALKK